MRRTPASDTVAEAVARELASYGVELSDSRSAQVGDAFTDLPEADRLVKSDPNAFLLGVLFTQGIAAERAWAGPYLLRERLGHLDPARLGAEREAVARAVAAPPALHRFKHTLGAWVGAAGARIATDWSGSAGRIWPDGTSVEDVTARLTSFDGIGRKKAAMAVSILRRHFGVQLSGIEAGTVAFDVHVRRVFLRSGLADTDDPQTIEAAARRAVPDEPDVLDLPAWLIGRDYCHPEGPSCEECRIGAVCARRSWIEVEGPGARPRREPEDAQSRERKSSPESTFG
jgi:uncharacterized HhH-GPD family protein